MVPLSFGSDADAASFDFAGQEMRLVQGRALYWPRECALLVADLHLEKASFFARHGQMLPPYDSRATLERLALAIRETAARRVYCLGDNFHDNGGAARLEPHAAGMLDALTRATEWLWITGNHDAALSAGAIGGEIAVEAEISGVALRHHARRNAAEAEISGHFHPWLTLAARGRRIARPCAVKSERRLIIPAFGALTGGMEAGAPAILAAMQPARSIDAIVGLRTRGSRATGGGAGDRLARFPLWRADHAVSP